MADDYQKTLKSLKKTMRKQEEQKKALSAKTEKSVAEIVRQGIDIMLINSSCKSSKEKKNE